MKQGSMEEQVLRASKEIIVKFIEVGRLSPTGFAESFKAIYEAIHTTVSSVSKPSKAVPESMTEASKKK
jgi:hypothetical protein